MPEMQDADLCKVVLRYEPETGKLFWRERPPEMFYRSGSWSAERRAKAWNSTYAGKEAFTYLTDDGYRQGAIQGRTIRAHRVIWLMMTGEPPFGVIDHIDGDRANNRWENLRSVTRSQNMRNMKMVDRNTSGATGVVRQGGSWVARLKANGKNLYLGSFKDIDEAIAARSSAQAAHGYTARHGVAP
jgi:hypothetical protein